MILMRLIVGRKINGKTVSDPILGFGSYLLRAGRSGISNLGIDGLMKKIVCTES